MAGLDAAHDEHHGGPRRMRAGPLLAPGQRMDAAPDRQFHQVVPSGMELDFVDAVAEAVVSAQDRRVLVGEASPLEGPTPGGSAQRHEAILGEGAPLAPDGFDQRTVLGVEIVSAKRRRLVGNGVRFDLAASSSGRLRNPGRAACRRRVIPLPERRFVVPDIVPADRQHVVALDKLKLEDDQVLVPERDLGGSEIELPHPAEALAVDLPGLVAAIEEARAPGLQGPRVMEPEHFEIGEHEPRALERRRNLRQGRNMPPGNMWRVTQGLGQYGSPVRPIVCRSITPSSASRSWHFLKKAS